MRRQQRVQLAIIRQGGVDGTAGADHDPVGDWPWAITATPAEVLGRPELGRLAAGGGADLVLLRARSWTELLSRPQADRIVVRAGRAVDTTPPDYRELDALLAPQGENA